MEGGGWACALRRGKGAVCARSRAVTLLSFIRSELPLAPCSVPAPIRALESAAALLPLRLRLLLLLLLRSCLLCLSWLLWLVWLQRR